MLPDTWMQNSFLRCIYLLVRRYLQHRVGVQSTALAFYLLFTIFPFLIFISALLGLLQLDIRGILSGAEDLLPQEILDLTEMYLTHVRNNSSPRLLFFGLFFSVYFPMRATNALMRAVRTAYHLGPPINTVRHISKTFLYTLLLIVSIILTLALMTVGDRLLSHAVLRLDIPPVIAKLWVLLRFPVAALVGYFALFFLYALAQDHHQPWRNIWPGTLAALSVWMLFSWFFALYVNNFAHYSALYGSIGAIIVLLIWLNISAALLILGAELNGTLINLGKDISL